MREKPKVPLLQAAISPSGMEAEVFFCLNNNIDSFARQDEEKLSDSFA